MGAPRSVPVSAPLPECGILRTISHDHAVVLILNSVRFLQASNTCLIGPIGMGAMVRMKSFRRA